MSKKRNYKKKGIKPVSPKEDELLLERDDHFSFIAGYTSGGAPFGLTCDEYNPDHDDNDQISLNNKHGQSQEQKREYIIQLDEKLLLGGVILSEWTTFLAKDSETAYCSGAYLSSILSSQAAIESHLRYDYFNSAEIKGWSFFELIEKSSLDDNLKNELHILRKFRNKWIHVNDPSNDEDLLERPEYYENELADFCTITIKTMLKILYSNPYI